MGISHFGGLQSNTFQGAIPESNVFGKTWYVDGTNGSDNNTGTRPNRAVATIGKAATTLGAAGDNIIIGPGTYTLSASFAPKARQFFRAAVINPRYPTISITSNSSLTGDMVTIDVDGTIWYGIEFLAGHANLATLVDIADTAAVNGVWFQSCVFNGADKTSVVGIQADDATFALTGMTIENCLFRDLTGTMIDIGALGMAYSLIRNNLFAIDINSGTAIALADTTAFATGKGYAIIQNDFTGFDATADEVGITIAGTENTTAAGIIRNNFFAYITAAAITIDKLSLSEVNNYVGDAATGGTLVDPGT